MEIDRRAGIVSLDAYRSSNAGGAMRVVVACGPHLITHPTAIVVWEGHAVLKSFVNAEVSWDGDGFEHQAWIVTYPSIEQQYDSIPDGPGGVVEPSKFHQDNFIRRLQDSSDLHLVLDSVDGDRIEASFKTVGGKNAIEQLEQACLGKTN